jgi:hypothetical protein
MNRRSMLTRGVVPALVVGALTALVTWPQVLYMGSRVGAHDDPLFSIWRLAWVAHALATDPTRLLDGNIFHPARNTLTFSDAMMLEGALAAPMFWVGVPPILIYNVLLLGGIAASGLAMFVLARHLLNATGPALVAAAIFTTAPYRIEHFMHLELQWAMWVPLTLWAIHRTVERRSLRDGLLVGVFLWLQILSSVYYGIFLTATAAVFVLLLLLAYPKQTWRAMPALLLGGLLTLVLAIPYALPYLNTSRTVGVRAAPEVAVYSATLWSYLVSAPQSWLWGWTSDRWGAVERSLFPGAVAIVLAVGAAAFLRRRMVLVYAALAVATIELSLGLNGLVYSWLFEHVDALHGLRAPSRFGIIVCCAIAVVAGFGAQMIAARFAAVGSRATGVAIALTLLVAIDNSTRGMFLMNPHYEPPNTFNVYKTIRALGPGAILELPIARLDALPGREALYMFWSTAHWHPIVNGYSGYYPVEFAETVVRTEHFPDDRSLLQLRNTGVRYIVVHRSFYSDEHYRDLLAKIGGRPELQPHGTYKDPQGEAQLFVLTK